MSDAEWTAMRDHRWYQDNNYDSNWARYLKKVEENGIPTKFSLRSVHLPFAFWNVALYYIKKHFSG